jgi:sec-independent protein translocase protein TatB
MLNIGSGEIAVILVVALLVLGPKRLPELARAFGKFMREFRRQTDEVRTTLQTEFYRMDQELLRDDKPPALPQSVPQKPYSQFPTISGPLDGGRRPADEIDTTRPRAPVTPAAPAAVTAEVAAPEMPQPAEPAAAPAPPPAPKEPTP